MYKISYYLVYNHKLFIPNIVRAIISKLCIETNILLSLVTGFKSLQPFVDQIDKL
jgi:hypothetical protein